jgi:hypothetical protein
VADRFYGVNKGMHFPVLVQEGASTTSRQVELRISDTVYANKTDVILALNAIRNYLQTKETSPIV